MFKMTDNYDEETVDMYEKENDDLFLDLIKERPALYDKSLKDYRDKIVRENAMQEIAHIMNETVEQCDQRWKRLQNSFRREKQLQDVSSKSGAGASARRKWQFFDRMQNMLSTNKSRPTYTNVPSTSAMAFENSAKKDSYNAIKCNSKKKRSIPPMELAFNQIHETMNTVIESVTNSKTAHDTTDDPDTLFGKLIAAELNVFSPKVAKKKKKINANMLG